MPTSARQPKGRYDRRGGVRAPRPTKGQGASIESVGADAHIGPPSNGRLSKIERVDVGIDPYERARTLPTFLSKSGSEKRSRDDATFNRGLEKRNLREERHRPSPQRSALKEVLKPWVSSGVSFGTFLSLMKEKYEHSRKTLSLRQKSSIFATSLIRGRQGPSGGAVDAAGRCGHRPLRHRKKPSVELVGRGPCAPPRFTRNAIVRRRRGGGTPPYNGTRSPDRTCRAACPQAAAVYRKTTED